MINLLGDFTITQEDGNTTYLHSEIQDNMVAVQDVDERQVIFFHGLQQNPKVFADSLIEPFSGMGQE